MVGYLTSISMGSEFYGMGVKFETIDTADVLRDQIIVLILAFSD